MSLFRRCDHDWREESRQVRKPVTDFEFGGGLWGEPHNDLLYGYTLVLYRCAACGNRRTEKLRGPWPGEEVGVGV